MEEKSLKSTGLRCEFDVQLCVMFHQTNNCYCMFFCFIVTSDMFNKYSRRLEVNALTTCLLFVPAERVRQEKLNIVCVPTSFQVGFSLPSWPT